MNKVKCFEIDESPYNQGKWLIRPVHENFFLKYTEGSFNVICARLFNLSYAQYLRFCRDLCGAQIVGKNSKYPYVVFNKDERLLELVKVLNSRANLILWNREHPDWREHQKELEQMKKLKQEKLNVSHS